MKQAIGVIDSGVGGLTVLHELMSQLPKEKFIYVGDTARCPYGSKTKKQIKRYVWEIVNYLIKKDVKCIVIACNTATAHTITELQTVLSIPIVGVIKPGAKAALKVTNNKKIGVIGTKGTIQSNSYTKVLQAIDSGVNVYSLACPLFVPIIEKGIISGKQAETIVSEGLAPFKNIDIDTLILGCTHYPIIKDPIQKELNSNVKIVSSGEETAKETSSILHSRDLLQTDTTISRFNHEFYTTGELISFKNITKLLFHEILPNLNKIKFDTVILS